MYKHLWLMISLALISACAQFPIAPRNPDSPPVITPPSAVSNNSAVLQLFETAANQRRAGDVAAAEATLERALRIEPHNAHLWLGLAEIAALSNQPDRARSLAERARSLAGGDSNIRLRAEQLLGTL